jgi:carbamoyl-phosphate synthase large subunit
MMDGHTATILVPGAAGAAGISAIKSLRRETFAGRIVATDGEPLSAGFAFSHASYVIPAIDDPSTYERMLKIMAREKVEIILPTGLTDTIVFSGNKKELASLGITFAGSDQSTVALCHDKLAFWNRVHSEFPVPALVEVKNSQPSIYPCFVKLRRGAGSRGCGRCRDEDDWKFYSKCGEELLALEDLPGLEYSVDVLSDLNGEPILAVPRERLGISDGVTIRARVRRDAEIEALCLRMARFLGIKGVCCMQLKRDGFGGVRFLEVNARLGGSWVISALAGVDLVKCLISMACGEPLKIPEYREITVVRHFEEVVVCS